MRRPTGCAASVSVACATGTTVGPPVTTVTGCASSVSVAWPSVTTLTRPIGCAASVSVAWPTATGGVPVCRMRTKTAGPRTFVVVPPAVAVKTGAAEPVPELTGARTITPPMSLPPELSGSATSVTVP